MGRDTFHPVSNTCDDDFGGWGATAIDALSTAIMFQNEDAVRRILEFIATVDFTKVTGGSSIQLFEVTIRHFGSILSAHDLLDGPFAHLVQEKDLRESLYRQMIELGNVLSCGYNTPSGIPRNWVNPTLCTTDDAHSNTIAGAGSLILEFARLSDITGHRVYVEHARRAEQYLIDPHPEKYVPWPGMLGTNVRVATGELIDDKGSWGSLADSFYEYLLKAYVYDSTAYAHYLERWKLAADSTIRYIASHPVGHPDWTFLPYWDGHKLFNAMDSLSWFAGGNFIYGGMITGNQTLVDFGLTIADTGGAMYEMTTTGLGGEFVVWTNDCNPGYLEDFRLEHCNASNSVQTTGKEFKLRPEVIESWYYAYRATQNPKYREWAWSAFQAIERVCKTESGYSAISDVDAVDGGKKLDQMESFVFAEVMKYIWLIHLEDDKAAFHVMDSRTGSSNKWVYNTEAHPFRVAGQPV
ncbi:hypothetical protein LTR10_002726 [Elasticomyces elasticus]|nr:hypothetical protein LTR10_002726 [Elasticomyces elasticus]KAK4967934.1 hypothetical protein LTR42_010262 [Elasticomyces elasticus]